MQQITTAQFQAGVKLDPAWASKLTKPIEIIGYCDMGHSQITHLSPLLRFTGSDETGRSANFWNCKFLKVAEGNFRGWVTFAESGIEKIGDLSCGKNKNGYSADFQGCKSLKIAEGKFPGYVDFSNTSIERIGDLSFGKNKNGYSADFQGCKSLKIAEGKFPGYVDFSNTSIEKIGDLSCGENNGGIRLNVKDCPNLKSIPISFNPREVKANPKLIEKLEVDRFIQKKRKEIEVITI